MTVIATSVRLVAVAAVVMASVGPARTGLTGPDAPDGCLIPTRHLTLYAVQVPDVEGRMRLGYGLTPGTASIPGPTIELWEGDCLALTVVNDIPRETLEALREEYGPFSHAVTPLGISAHPHGVKYRSNSDGVPDNDWQPGSYVPPGEARTFLWYAAPQVHVGKRVKSLGTAGYWWYHDHVAGTTHGTGGVGSGLFGALIVRRPGDLVPDRTFVVTMGDNATLNHKRHPETDCEGPTSVVSNHCLVGKLGDRVEFVVIGMGNDFHTFHMHGHVWADNRTGAITTPLDETRLIDAKTVGPSESFGFQLIAGESVGVGSWMLHCHVQSHSDAGMKTFFHVTHDGRPPHRVGESPHHEHGILP